MFLKVEIIDLILRYFSRNRVVTKVCEGLKKKQLCVVCFFLKIKDVIFADENDALGRAREINDKGKAIAKETKSQKEK